MTDNVNRFIGHDQMSLMYHCLDQDIKLYKENLEVERIYCNKIKHAYDLTNFILTVKPFVCLNYDQNGFNLVRQDKCDKHQANPLLTGQLLFGIVQTNPTSNVPSATPAKNLP
jgi:hypothetical protein